MKVLLRKCGEKYYVWKEATLENGNYYADYGNGNKQRVSQTEIIATKDDERIGYVQCASCGELIKNDPESIEAHYAKREAEKDCFKCGRLRTNNKVIIYATGNKNVDGKYTVTQTYTADLMCGTGYWGVPIDSQDVIHNCKYYACRNSGVQPINDIFVKYPGLFDKSVTVDMLIKKNYERNDYLNGFFEYDMKCRGTLVACVNEMGIIDHFRLRYKHSSYRLYYSDKYNLLFIDSYMSYSETIPYNVSDAKWEQVKAKIAALYKEASK